MARPVLTGIKALKLPVTDVARSARWYADVFGFTVTLEFPDEDGAVRGVAGEIPGLGSAGLALRENPEVARGLAGFDPVLWAVADRAALADWIEHLDRLGIEHSPVIEATVGWLIVLKDPDDIELHLYTDERHGADHSDRAGYGRPAD